MGDRKAYLKMSKQKFEKSVNEWLIAFNNKLEELEESTEIVQSLALDSDYQYDELTSIKEQMAEIKQDIILIKSYIIYKLKKEKISQKDFL